MEVIGRAFSQAATRQEADIPQYALDEIIDMNNDHHSEDDRSIDRDYDMESPTEIDTEEKKTHLNQSA